MIKRSFFSLTKPGFKYDSLETNLKEPESIPVPDNLILLLNEPITSAKISLIKKGTLVTKGEKLCLYNDSTEYVISPVTGLISDIDTFIDNLGQTATYIVIKNNQTNADDNINYDLLDDIFSADNYLRALPGAPPLKKLADNDNKINTIVITCTDNDLCATTSQYVSSQLSNEIKQGALILKKLAKVEKLCLTIPENSKIKQQFDTMQVFETSRQYPSNLPALILKNHLNIILPAGKTPEDVGVCFISAEAVASLGKAYQTKTISFEKHLTIIDKQGDKHRVTAHIGTAIGKIFKALDIDINNGDRIILGGPMQGSATYTLSHPVMPDMDTIMIQDKEIIPQVSDNACINCGKCVQICPANIPINIL
ncbi:4Fe-4S binding protein, partial [bacterium]|nr:4Fe-4S binding protein [bacterium]